MFYIKLISNLVLVLSRFIRLLICSFIETVSRYLISYWISLQESLGSSSLHLPHVLENIIGADNDEKFDPKFKDGSSVDFDLKKGNNVVLEKSPPQVNKEAFAFLEMLSKIIFNVAKVDENVVNEKKKLAAKEKILKRMDLVSCDADDLSSKISKVVNVNCMTDDEVQAALLESREWKMEMKALKKNMEAVLIDSVGVDIDEEEMKQFQEMVKLVIA